MARARAARAAASVASGGAGYRGGQGVDPKRIEEIKELYGFDKPAHERFWQMLGQFARFDLGTQLLPEQGRVALVLEKLPVSISLGLWTFFISYLHRGAAGRGQGGAGRHALRLRHHA